MNEKEIRLSITELIEELKKYPIEDREAIMISAFDSDPVPIYAATIPYDACCTAGTEPSICAPIDVYADFNRYDVIKNKPEYSSIKVFTYKLKFKLKADLAFVPGKERFNIPETVEMAKELFQDREMPDLFGDFLTELFYHEFKIRITEIED